MAENSPWKPKRKLADVEDPATLYGGPSWKFSLEGERQSREEQQKPSKRLRLLTRLQTMVAQGKGGILGSKAQEEYETQGVSVFTFLVRLI